MSGILSLARVSLHSAVYGLCDSCVSRLYYSSNVCGLVGNSWECEVTIRGLSVKSQLLPL